MYAMSLGFEKYICIYIYTKNLYYTYNMCAYIDPLCVLKEVVKVNPKA